jgi:hypothetical protein
MRLQSPENFSENGARPGQFLGPNQGRLIGWARSFSDLMTVTDNTMLGGRSQERLTRIAGRDVRTPDGHTVGKTFSRKELWASPRQPSSAERAAAVSNPIAASAEGRDPRVDPSASRVHKISGLQNGTRATGLGDWLPGFLRSNQLATLKFYRLTMPEENSH